MRPLTKTAFLKGRQCDLRLWRWGQHIDEYTPDDDAGDPAEDFTAEAALVESYAYQLIPGGVPVIEPVDDDEEAEQRPDFSARVRATTELIEDPNTVAIYQAHLVTDDLLGVVDILERTPGGWKLIEVKASSEVKPIHHLDLAFQVHLARATGLSITGAEIIHLDKQYEFPGGEISAGLLLHRKNVTPDVDALKAFVATGIKRQQSVLDDPEPTVAPTSRCKGNPGGKDADRPSTCGHLSSGGLCGSALDRNWVWNIPDIRGKQKPALLADLPRPDMTLLDPEDPIKWSDKQKDVIYAAIEGKPQVDKNQLRIELDRIQWPVAYIDFEFETGMAVPRFLGMRPYDRIPFQWSMHVQDEEGGDLRASQPFLHTTSDDPRRAFLDTLLAALPDSGSIVVHYRSAEMTVLNSYARWYDDEYTAQVQAIEARLVDTCDIGKSTYCHPDQWGSWSIKKFGPALTGRGYEGLDIQDGMAAVRTWRSLLAGNEAEPEETKRQLLEYCGRDTELMHDVLQSLRGLL